MSNRKTSFEKRATEKNSADEFSTDRSLDADLESPIDWDEAFEYLPGSVVELTSQPGVVDTVAYYEPMMVPPIWLENDPRPRYPHELRILSRQEVQGCSLDSQFAVV